MAEHPYEITFGLRSLHNQINRIVQQTMPKTANAPQTQLQAGIMGFLFHHSEQPVYQKNLEEEFHISRATATNTLQVMEKNGLIIRKPEEKDARLKKIVMTPEALQRHSHVEAHMDVMEKQMLKDMTAEEKENLKRLLLKVHENLSELERPEKLESLCEAAGCGKNVNGDSLL